MQTRPTALPRRPPGSVSRELFLQSLTAQEVPLTEEELQNLAGHYTEAFSEKVGELAPGVPDTGPGF